MIKPRAALDDCFLHDKDRLKHGEALDILKAQLSALGRTHQLGLNEATGRIIAEEISAPHNVPLLDNSAVDGYAFRHVDYEQGTDQFAVVARIAAGDLTPVRIPRYAAARIFTGAAMPDNTDSIAMQEDCTLIEKDGTPFICIPPGLKQGANRRRAGEDVEKGSQLFAPGKRLTAADIAALASLGKDKICAYEPVRVAILSTGDELVEPGKPIKPGQVYNSNAPLLESLARTLPVTVTNAGIVRDDHDTISETLLALSKSHDVILTTGGASRGDEDHILNALDEIGRRHLWQLAIKPGRPMTFGHIGQAAFIGLPGNPVAAFVCFLLYARHIILSLGGAEWQTPQGFDLPAAFSLKSKKTDRREFQRGILRQVDGQLMVDKFKRDGSGLIASLREADGLIEISEEVSALQKGDRIRFIPFTSFGL